MYVLCPRDKQLFTGFLQNSLSERFCKIPRNTPVISFSKRIYSSYKFEQLIYRTPSYDCFRHFLNVGKVYAKSDFTLTFFSILHHINQVF